MPHSPFIDIWQFSLAQQPEGAFFILNEEEQQRALRFHFQRHRRRFITARAMLRAILSRYLGLSAKNLEFEYNPYGKPELNNLPFNLSHSGDTALLAVGKESALGIDVECFSMRPWLEIAEKMFSNQEYEALKALPSSLTALEFFRTWTQKEALIKVSGLGLNYPTREFSVPVPGVREHQVWDPVLKKTLNMFTFMPRPGCCAALCTGENILGFKTIPVVPEVFLKRPA